MDVPNLSIIFDNEWILVDILSPFISETTYINWFKVNIVEIQFNVDRVFFTNPMDMSLKFGSEIW